MSASKYFTQYIMPAIVSGIAAYGAFWTFADSFGVEGRPASAFIILALSTVFSTIAALVKMILNLRKEVTSLRARLQSSQQEQSYCCVVKQDKPVCPVGIARIVPRTEDTIRPSLRSAKRTFRWLGLSAFNVIHGNHDIFESKPNVAFDFRILSQDNLALQSEVNRYYGDVRGRMNAKELIDESEKLIARLQNDLNANIKVSRYNQIPTFRIVNVDEDQTFVSFYERGIDALKTFQLELVHSPEVAYPIKNWFDAFVDKSAITEKYIGSGII